MIDPSNKNECKFAHHLYEGGHKIGNTDEIIDIL
jgi:hypothetical protein